MMTIETTTTAPAKNVLAALWSDDAGFIVSAELVLVGTIAVLSMVVGLSEVANNVNLELEDVGTAVGKVNQSYSFRLGSGPKGRKTGTSFHDTADRGDAEGEITCDAPAVPEGYYSWN